MSSTPSTLHQTTRTEQMTSSPSEPAGTPSVWRVLKDQRKTMLVALIMVVAAFWVPGQLGEWRLAFSISAGALLGLLNHLATEYWLLRIISSGAQPTKGQLARSTMVRLAVLTVVAVVIAVLLWP